MGLSASALVVYCRAEAAAAGRCRGVGRSVICEPHGLRSRPMQDRSSFATLIGWPWRDAGPVRGRMGTVVAASAGSRKILRWNRHTGSVLIGAEKRQRSGRALGRTDGPPCRNFALRFEPCSLEAEEPEPSARLAPHGSSALGFAREGQPSDRASTQEMDTTRRLCRCGIQG